MVVKWLDEPEAHDFDAAADYLSLVGDPDVVEKTVAALRRAEPAYRKAKDILRAAHLDLLPTSNPHVKADLDKIRNGTRLSPILLVRGNAIAGCASADRRRLPQGVRELRDRRKHCHPLPFGVLAGMTC